MTLVFFPFLKGELAINERFYISQFDGDTYQIIDSVENREVCVCSNYDEKEDAKERAEKIAMLLHARKN
jgi:hypothetical protein